MKFHAVAACVCAQMSPPSRAAWIEIIANGDFDDKQIKSPPSRAAWIEILHLLGDDIPEESPPSRAAWIEIEDFVKYLFKRLRRRLHGRRGLKSQLRL